MSMERRRFRLMLVYFAALLPWLVYGALGTLSDNANSPLDWVPSHFPPRAAFNRFEERFGSGDLLIASWPGCRVDQPELDTIVRRLQTSRLFADADGNPLFERAVSGRTLWNTLRAMAFDEETIRRRLAGTWIGPDGATTVLVVAFTPQGLARRRELVDRIQAVIHRVAEMPYGDIHLAGPVIDGLSVDRSSQEALNGLALPSAILVFLLSWWCLRDVRAAATVFGVATLCQLCTLALIHYTGGRMNALLIVLPPLIQVLAISGGLHLANYYRSTQAPSPGEATHRALRLGWLPCLLSGGTTALGIGSLIVSQLTPIRSFAIYGAAGVVVTTVLVLVFVPQLLARTGVPPRGAASPGGAEDVPSRRLVTFARLLERRAGAVVLLFFIVLAAASAGVGRLRTSVRIETLFPSGSRILRDYAWLEEHIGPLVPIEVLLEFPRGESAWVERLGVVQRVERDLSAIEPVGATLSAATWLPPGSNRALTGDMVTALPAQLEQLGYARTGETTHTLRVTAFVSALRPIDYESLLQQVADRVDRLLVDTAAGRSVDATYTGTMPLVHAIQRQLMRDLFLSFLGALGTVTIVMTLVQGGIAAGLLAMMPNLFPVVTLFGWLGWWGAPLDIGSVMTAGVALGIAVDDTFHYLVAYHRGMAEGGSRAAAVARAYADCGWAMLQTSLTCGLGLLLFAATNFVPTRRFAWMMAALLGLAIIGDLVLLPALLLSRLGQVVGGPSDQAPRRSSDASSPVIPRRRAWSTDTAAVPERVDD